MDDERAPKRAPPSPATRRWRFATGVCNQSFTHACATTRAAASLKPSISTDPFATSTTTSRSSGIASGLSIIIAVQPSITTASSSRHPPFVRSQWLHTVCACSG
jgi:hypothetical protein